MSNNVYRLMLIDSDRIFRMGMQSWLEQFPDLLLVAETDAAASALEILQQQISQTSQQELDLDLVLLDLNLSQPIDPTEDITSPQGNIGLNLCQQMKSQYPSLPILLLSSYLRPELVTIALRSGVEGFCLKGTPTEELIRAIRQVASGNPYLGDRDNLEISFPQQQVVSLPNAPISVLAIIKHNFYLSGLKKIDRELTQVQAQLQAQITTNQANSGSTEQPLSDRLMQMVLAGQARELQAARWFIKQLWGSRKSSQLLSPTAVDNRLNTGYTIGYSNDQSLAGVSEPNIEVVDDGRQEQNLNNVLAVQASLWDRTVTKLQSNLTNISKTPLEIDILKEEKKRELLYIALRQFENSLTELRLSPIQPSQLIDQIPTILKNIWEETVVGFFGKYYQIKNSVDVEVNLVEVLLKDSDIVEREILAQIPYLDDLIAHLLFNSELMINSSSAALGTPEAMQRAELILDNLIIQIANAVIQPLLNHFANSEEVKQSFYRYNLLATREIERFRNNLSWKYRLEKYIIDPQLIFESRHTLFVLANPCIKKASIYAPRNAELEQLQGIQLAVTLVLELQDAIAPRLKSAIAFMGSGFVYVLTNVIGRGIGLIGRGILQGIGNAWQESRPKK